MRSPQSELAGARHHLYGVLHDRFSVTAVKDQLKHSAYYAAVTNNRDLSYYEQAIYQSFSRITGMDEVGAMNEMLNGVHV